MEKRVKTKTTITIDPKQKEFVDTFSKQHKDWNLSKFVQEQLDELMHQDSSQIKRMIEEKEKLQQEVNKQIELDIQNLKKQYDKQQKREEQINKKKQAAFPQRKYDYGT